MYIWPRKPHAGTLLHLNDSLRSAYEFDASEKTIEKGWELHQQLLDDAIGERTQ